MTAEGLVSRILFACLCLLVALGSLGLLGLLFNIDAYYWHYGLSTTWKEVLLPVKGLLWGEEAVLMRLYLSHVSFVGEGRTPQALLSHAHLIILGFSLSVLLARTTTWKKTAFLSAMVGLAVLMYLCHFQHLRLWGVESPLISLFIALPLMAVAWTWRRFSSQSSHVGLKVLSFVGAWTLIALCIGFGAAQEKPFVLLAHYVYLPGLIGCVIFFLAIAPESIYLIARLTTYAPNRSNGRNFVLLSLLYLGNLFFTWSKQSLWVSWSMQHIDVWFWLCLSSGIALWHWKDHKESRWERGALMLWCLSVLLFHHAEANDMAIEVLEDTLLYAHMGVGLMFFLYIMAWLRVPLFQRLPVWKILYKGENVPFVYPFGATVMLLFFFYTEKLSYYQGMSGFYNGLAESHRLLKNQPLAHEYDKLGSFYGYNSHKANYHLGQYHLASGEVSKAVHAFRRAVEKNPSVASLLQLSRAQQRAGLRHRALETLRRGAEVNRDVFQHNLALRYALNHQADSARHYWLLCGRNEKVQEAAAANLLGFGLDNPFTIQSPQTEAYRSNQLVQSLLAHKGHPTLPFISRKDSLWSFGHVWNQTLYEARERLEPTVTAIDDLPYAVYLYNTEQVARAFRHMDRLQIADSRHRGHTFYLLGVWAAEQQARREAQRFFQKAKQVGYEVAHETKWLDLSPKQRFGDTIKWQDKSEKELELLSQKNPFQETLTLRAVKELNQRNKIQEAYDALVEGIEIHSYSVALWKAYTLQALKIGLESYAEDGLERLQTLLSPKEHAQFLRTYKRVRQRENEDFF